MVFQGPSDFALGWKRKVSQRPAFSKSWKIKENYYDYYTGGLVRDVLFPCFGSRRANDAVRSPPGGSLDGHRVPAGGRLGQDQAAPRFAVLRMVAKSASTLPKN